LKRGNVCVKLPYVTYGCFLQDETSTDYLHTSVPLVEIEECDMTVTNKFPVYAVIAVVKS
jgi:hypothetical protein